MVGTGKASHRMTAKLSAPARLALAIALCACFFSVSAQAEETLDSIRSTGILLWGSDAEGGAPYVFPDPDNPEKLIGFEVDIANALAQKLGVTARQFQVNWASLLPALKRGDFHMAMNGIEWTAQRASEFELSNPYYIYAQQLVVRGDEDSIHTLNDVVGKQVGTLGGTVAHDMLKSLPGVNIKVYEGQVEPYRDLELRRLDAVLMDSPIAAYYARPNPALKYAGQPIGENVYAIAFRKGDAAFRERINGIIAAMFQSGEMRSIYERWGLWNQAQTLTSVSAKAPDGNQTAGKTGLSAYLPLLLQGAAMTVLISSTAMALAVVLGLAVVLARLAGGGFLKSLATFYVEIIRGTPLLLQLYIVYYGLPNIGLNLNAFTAAVLALGINYSAYESEIYRAGIDSIPKEQREAALSLGMTEFMIYRRILFPQAAKIVLPPVTNDFIALFKDSSLVSTITIVELTKTYNMLAVSSMRFLELGLVTAALYLAMSLPLSFLSRRLERKLHTP
jgi:polar amino acid transport system substrate-binding protein